MSIGAGLDFIGSIAGAGAARRNARHDRSQNLAIFQSQHRFAREQFRYQQLFNRNQLRWRVADARAAGLHPLAALGVNPGSFSPVMGGAGGMSDSGSAVGDAIRDVGRSAGNFADTVMDKYSKRQMDATTRRMEAEAGLAEEQYLASVEARTAQSANHRQDLGAIPDLPDPVPRRTPLAGGAKLPGDPQFSAQAAENKYGEISEIDGALERLIDAYRFTRENWLPAAGELVDILSGGRYPNFRSK